MGDQYQHVSVAQGRVPALKSAQKENGFFMRKKRKFFLVSGLMKSVKDVKLFEGLTVKGRNCHFKRSACVTNMTCTLQGGRNKSVLIFVYMRSLAETPSALARCSMTKIRTLYFFLSMRVMDVLCSPALAASSA